MVIILRYCLKSGIEIGYWTRNHLRIRGWRKPTGTTMRRILGFELWLAIAVLASGCAGGLHRGNDLHAYLDTNGEVVKVYATDYDQTIQAAIETLAAMGVPVTSRLDGRYRTAVQSRTPDGSPLRLRFIREGRNLTVVRVRTGNFGHRHQEYSAQIHALLSARIERGSERDASPASAAIAGPSPAAKPTVPKTTRPSAGPSPVRDAPPETAAPKRPARPQPDYIVFFGRNSNSLSPEALHVLDEAVNLIFANPDTVVLLTGYADVNEDTEVLQLVSESRALTVKFYLVGKGVDDSRIRAEGHGSGMASTHRAEGSQFRRVELRLTRGL
jgi:outer membrane protein OmpA-like peptidoglycan-associated protein